jgi:putative ABC transport system permease protein
MFASLFLKSLANIHLHPYNPDTDEPDDRTQTLVAVGATGALILILAVINFVNLVTARATQRAVEVGIRKSHGALRRQLMLQFMGEAFGYALVSTLLGMVLCAFSLPSLNAFLDRHIRFDFGHDPLLAIAPFAIAVVLGLLAGFYPAVILSRFSPALVLKAGAGATVGGSAMRLSLVAFQFTVTISLLIGALVMYRQISFASSQALGFDKDLVLTVELPGRPDLRTPDGLGQRMTGPVEAIRARLAAVHGVQATAASFVVPQMTQFTSLNFGRSDQPGGPAVTLNVLPVDFGYFDLYRIRLLAGRDFSRRFVDDKMVPDDPSRLSSAIINETTLHAFGFTDPQAAIGQEIHGMDQGVPERHFHIIGVVPDFPLDSIRNPVPPDLFVIDPDMFNVLSLKLSGADLPETLRGIDAAWHQAVPERPIHRMFLDDRIAGLYLDIGRNERLLAASAAFAVAIGCLGLIGLSAYTAERRTKEIGIRKALGASTSDIARLLIWQFAKPVLLANVLAWPIAWWFMRHWLNGFAYRIELGPEPFLFAGAAGLAIAVATTAFHAIHVARARPASALRYE